jgi:hypothetical protein
MVQHPGGEEILDPGESWLSPVAAGFSPQKSEAKQETIAHDPASTVAPDAAVGRTENSALLRSHKASGSSLGVDDRDSKIEQNTALFEATAGVRKPDEVTSTLSRQNALLEAALLAEKRGDRARAEALVDRLLHEYPQSPLRGSAQAVKKRLSE